MEKRSAFLPFDLLPVKVILAAENTFIPDLFILTLLSTILTVSVLNFPATQVGMHRLVTNFPCPVADELVHLAHLVELRITPPSAQEKEIERGLTWYSTQLTTNVFGVAFTGEAVAHEMPLAPLPLKSIADARIESRSLL